MTPQMFLYTVWLLNYRGLAAILDLTSHDPQGSNLTPRLKVNFTENLSTQETCQKSVTMCMCVFIYLCLFCFVVVVVFWHMLVVLGKNSPGNDQDECYTLSCRTFDRHEENTHSRGGSHFSSLFPSLLSPCVCVCVCLCVCVCVWVK